MKRTSHLLVRNVKSKLSARKRSRDRNGKQSDLIDEYSFFVCSNDFGADDVFIKENTPEEAEGVVKRDQSTSFFLPENH